LASAEKRWALVWLGGAATGYEPVTYRLGGQRARSVLAAAALNKLLAAETGGFEKRLVLVPETLFAENHCGMYRLLLEAKTGYKGKRLVRPKRGGPEDITRPDELAQQLLEQGFDCRVVPHPGAASPIVLEQAHGEEGVYQARFGGQEVHEAPFEAMLNTVYAALRGLSRDGYSLVIDLSHGTNPLVSATLLAASMIAAVYGPDGVETRIYMAPVMGKVGEGTEVEFIDMTGAAGTVNTVASGINAWKMLDERLLPRDAVTRISGRLGRRYGPLYGKVKAVVEKSAELLWTLRSGQVPLVPERLEALAGLQRRASQGLETILQDPDAVAADVAWVPVADAVLASTQRLTERLRHDTNMGTILAALGELVEKDMPDRALGSARELVVALLAAKQQSPGDIVRVEDHEWKRISGLLEKCARTGDEEETMLSAECSSLPLSNEELAAYSRARQLRNKLMHGRLSKEENVAIEILEAGDIKVVSLVDGGKTAPLRTIKVDEVKNTVKKLVNVLVRLHYG